MKRIVLLRFHKDLEVVQNRINLIKYFNPEVSIYGLFGGEKEDFSNYKRLRGLEHIHFLDISERDIKWRFSDHAILKWFKEYGYTISFDVIHIVEYDLVLLASLSKLYPYKENERHIYLTSVIDLEIIKPEWNWFQNPEFPIDECKQFEKLIKEKYHISTMYGVEAPGTTLTREYLEGYINLDLPLIAFDEMRLPAIAQILGIPIKDNGFEKDWFDEEGRDFQLFNTDNHEVQIEDMFKAVKEGYQFAFHPVLIIIDIESVKYIQGES